MLGWFQRQETGSLRLGPPSSGIQGVTRALWLSPHPHWTLLGPSPHLTCGQAAVGIEAEDGIGADVTVREEAVTGLQWERGDSAVGSCPGSHSEHLRCAKQESCGRVVKKRQ